MSQFLVLGQIGDPTAALPGGAGSKLWYLSPDSYGQQVASTGGLDSLLRYDTDDYPVLGDAGRTLLRRLFVKIAYSVGAAVVKVTPRIDYNTLLTPKTFSVGAPMTRRFESLDVEVARVCSYVGARIEVLSRAGLVEILGLACAHKPLAQAADYVAGTPP